LNVAGACHSAADPKGKGKAQAVDNPPKSTKCKLSGAAGPLEPKKQKECAAGTPNYAVEDIDRLLDILKVRLPVGAKGWNLAANEFCKWAEENSHSARTAKFLKLKFKQVC
jgi:hypothetical protein